MKKLFILFLLVVCNGFSVFAKDSTKIHKHHTNKFNGKSIITIFANQHFGIGDVSHESGFAIKRAYLGYKFDNSGNWYGQVIFDIASANTINKELEFIAYLKNAYLTWSKSNFKLNFGIIKTHNFGIQEKAWGHRYLMKSFSDEYGLAPSADLGISASYIFTDWLEADLSFTNGKGHKKLEISDNYRYGFGLTFKPINGLIFRVFYDLFSRDNYDINNTNQHTTSAFIGYEHSKFSLGGEYNYMFNSDYKKDINIGGFSLFSTIKIIDKLYAFARYDNFYANSDMIDDTGYAIRAGIDYRPFRFLRISPNIHNWKPTNSASQTYIYLNLLINF